MEPQEVRRPHIHFEPWSLDEFQSTLRNLINKEKSMVSNLATLKNKNDEFVEKIRKMELLNEQNKKKIKLLENVNRGLEEKMKIHVKEKSKIQHGLEEAGKKLDEQKAEIARLVAENRNYEERTDDLLGSLQELTTGHFQTGEQIFQLNNCLQVVQGGLTELNGIVPE